MSSRACRRPQVLGHGTGIVLTLWTPRWIGDVAVEFDSAREVDRECRVVCQVIPCRPGDAAAQERGPGKRRQPVLALNFVKSATPCGRPQTDRAHQLPVRTRRPEGLRAHAAGARPLQPRLRQQTFGSKPRSSSGPTSPKVPIVWAGSAIAVSNKIHGFVPSAAQAEYFAPASR